mmetsp:Transcript_2181/g.3148  ORF Transcript_2181/g.3148 Transcript_2181/m.3148 type:complete len:80 (-) Transcript_2181:798-1037(-)
MSSSITLEKSAVWKATGNKITAPERMVMGKNIGATVIEIYMKAFIARKESCYHLLYYILLFKIDHAFSSHCFVSRWLVD